MKAKFSHSNTTTPSSNIHFYQLKAPDGQPLLIKKPTAADEKDPDLQNHPAFLHLWPYSKQKNSKFDDIKHTPELSEDDAKRFVFENQLFHTRTHAINFYRCQFLLEFINQVDDLRKPIADDLNIKKLGESLMAKCCVKNNDTHSNPGKIQDSVDKLYRQFSDAFESKLREVNCLSEDEIFPDKYNPTRSNRDKLNQIRHDILDVYIKQYPELLNMILLAWERGIIPVDIDELTELASDKSVSVNSDAYRDSLPSTRATLSILYQASELEFPEQWFLEFCQQCHRSCVRSVNKEQLSFFESGSLVIPPSNLTPGTAFSHKIIDKSQLRWSDLLEREEVNLPGYLMDLIADCVTEQTNHFVIEPLSNVSSTSTTPSATPSYSIIDSTEESHSQTGTVKKSEIESESEEETEVIHIADHSQYRTPKTQQKLPHQKLDTPLNQIRQSPAIRQLQTNTPLSQRAHRLNQLVSGSQARKFAAKRTIEFTGKVPSMSTDSTPYSTPLGPRKKLFPQFNREKSNVGIVQSSDYSLANTESWISESQSSQQAAQQSRLQLVRQLSTLELSENQSDPQSPNNLTIELLSTTNQAVRMAYLEKENHIEIKFCFQTSSIASLFRNRFVHRYGLSDDNVQCESAAYYATNTKQNRNHHFAVSVKAPSLFAFWMMIHDQHECPSLFPHFGQEYLAVIEHFSDNESSTNNEERMQWYVYCKDYQETQHGVFSDYLKQYQGEIPKPFQDKVQQTSVQTSFFGISDDSDKTGMSEILSQYHCSDHHDDKESQKHFQHQQQWLTHYIEHSFGLQQDSSSLNSLHRVDEGNNSKIDNVFYDETFTDFIREQEFRISNEQLLSLQETSRVYLWDGGERSSLSIWAMNHGHAAEIQNSTDDQDRADTLSTLTKNKIIERSKSPEQKMSDSDIGHCLIVSSMDAQLRHCADGSFPTPGTLKHQHCLPAISPDAQPALYLQEVKSSQSQLFKTKTLKLSDNVRLDCKMRFNTLVNVMRDNESQAAIFNLDPIGETDKAWSLDCFKIQVQALMSALEKQPHQLKLVFISSPVSTMDGACHEYWKTCLKQQSWLSTKGIQVVLANVEQHAAFTVVSRFMKEKANSSLAIRIEESALQNPCPIAEVVQSEHYPLPLEFGREQTPEMQKRNISKSDSHRKGMTQSKIEKSCLDSTRLFTQNPNLNPHFQDITRYAMHKFDAVVKGLRK